MKFVFPCLWFPFVFFVPAPNWLFVFACIAGSIFIWRTSVRLKEVSVDQDLLYISNFLKEISIPLSEIRDVSQNHRLNSQTVTIHLYSPSEFGDKIIFMPTTRFFAHFSSHPVVAELKELARSKRVALHSRRSR